MKMKKFMKKHMNKFIILGSVFAILFIVGIVLAIVMDSEEVVEPVETTDEESTLEVTVEEEVTEETAESESPGTPMSEVEAGLRELIANANDDDVVMEVFFVERLSSRGEIEELQEETSILTVGMLKDKVEHRDSSFEEEFKSFAIEEYIIHTFRLTHIEEQRYGITENTDKERLIRYHTEKMLRSNTDVWEDRYDFFGYKMVLEMSEEYEVLYDMLDFSTPPEIIEHYFDY